LPCQTAAALRLLNDRTCPPTSSSSSCHSRHHHYSTSTTATLCCVNRTSTRNLSFRTFNITNFCPHLSHLAPCHLPNLNSIITNPSPDFLMVDWGLHATSFTPSEKQY
jgi:hypothetical protein